MAIQVVQTTSALNTSTSPFTLTFPSPVTPGNSIWLIDSGGGFDSLVAYGGTATDDVGNTYNRIRALPKNVFLPGRFVQSSVGAAQVITVTPAAPSGTPYPNLWWAIEVSPAVSLAYSTTWNTPNLLACPYGTIAQQSSTDLSSLGYLPQQDGTTNLYIIVNFSSGSAPGNVANSIASIGSDPALSGGGPWTLHPVQQNRTQSSFWVNKSLAYMVGVGNQDPVWTVSISPASLRFNGDSYAGAVVFVPYVPPVVVPTVTTQSVTSITTTLGLGNGNITNLGGAANCTAEGFVYGTSSQSLPGNAAPGSSGYTAFVSQSGTFNTGAFTESITGLTANTAYFARAWAQNSAGYSYGGEVSFTTVAISSTLVASPTSVIANGVSKSIITATVLDPDTGAPVVGAAVSLVGTGSSIISAPSGLSGAGGVVTFTTIDTVPEVSVYTASTSLPSFFNSTTSVTFTAVPTPPTPGSETMTFRSDGWVKAVSGQAVAGAQIFVCNQPANIPTSFGGSSVPSPLTPLFSDPNGLVPLAQPVITDGFGHYDYYTASGTYTVLVYNNNTLQQVYPDQSVAVAGFSSPVVSPNQSIQFNNNGVLSGSPQFLLNAVTGVVSGGPSTTTYINNSPAPSTTTTSPTLQISTGVPFSFMPNPVDQQYAGIGYTSIFTDFPAPNGVATQGFEVPLYLNKGYSPAIDPSFAYQYCSKMDFYTDPAYTGNSTGAFISPLSLVLNVSSPAQFGQTYGLLVQALSTIPVSTTVAVSDFSGVFVSTIFGDGINTATYNINSASGFNIIPPSFSGPQSGTITFSTGINLQSPGLGTGTGTIATHQGIHIASQSNGNPGGRNPNAWGIHEDDVTERNALGSINLGGDTGPIIATGTGSPEGTVVSPIAGMYLRQDGSIGSTLYTKQSGSGATGWAPISGTSVSLLIDNDTTPAGPTPQIASLASPPYQDSVFNSTFASTVQVASNVLTVVTPNVFQVGQTVTFRNLSNSTFLNGQSVVVTGISRPTATITHISWLANVLTVTCANTFVAGQVVYLGGLTTNTQLNGTALAISTVSGSQFTALLINNLTIVNGSDTGTVTSFENESFTSNFTHADVGPTGNASGTVGVAVSPFLWVYDTFNQNWFDCAFIDTQYGPPGGPVGRFTFSRPFAYNDTGAPTTGIKQAMVDIDHRTGNSVGHYAGQNSFDVALGIVNEGYAADVSHYSNQYSIYLETRLRGTPAYYPSPGEDSASGARFVCVDYRSTSASALSSNYCGISANYAWAGDGGAGTIPMPGGNQAFGGRFTATNSSSTGGTLTLSGSFVGVSGTASDSSTGGPSASGNGIGGYFSSSNFSNSNLGISVPDHGTGVNNWDAIFYGGNKDSGKVGISTLIMGGTAGGAHQSIRTIKAGAPNNAAINTDVAGKLPFTSDAQNVAGVAVFNNEVFVTVSSSGKTQMLVYTEAVFAAVGAATFLNTNTIKLDSTETNGGYFGYTAPFTHANYGNNVTALSLTSNVLTVTCANSYSAGNVVFIWMFGDATWNFLNAVPLTVNAGGLSGSQFTANITHVNTAGSITGTIHIATIPESAGTLTGNTTCSYTLTETYNQNPMVFITPAVPGSTTFTVSALSTTSFTVTASAPFLGVVNYMLVGQN